MSQEHKNQEDTFRPIVGIDLGTTNSAVAYISGGKPHVLASPAGARIIPSVVLIQPNGSIVVGEDARASLVAMPERTLASVKRHMGEPEPLVIAGQELLPEEISALILRELKSYVDEHYGEGEKEAVITVPAYFNDEQRRATKRAGELAGFVVERIVNEPTAAALAFGLEHLEEDRVFLVYDLGGGTFDVSVVEMMAGLLEVRSSSGNSQLGGEDFDWRLVDYLSELILQEHGVDPREDIRARALLKNEAEDVKKRLSSSEHTRISIPLVLLHENKPISLELDFTRQQFVSLIEDLLSETMDKVEEAVREAELDFGQIDEVLLVGGSTRIPRVKELIEARVGRQVRTDVHPDEAVALGAAVQGGLKSGLLAQEGLVVTDVAPFSMGIAVLKEGRAGMKQPGGYAPVITRNTTIPTTRTQPFYTSAPGQTAVSIEIYQGEQEWVKHNHLLGEFLLQGVPASEVQQQVDVTFRYNLNGILEVTAKAAVGGREMKVTVQDALQRDSQQAFEDSIHRLEELYSAVQFEDDLEGEDVFLDEELDSYSGETVLHEDARRLQQSIREKLEELPEQEREHAEKLLAELEAASSGASEDMERLQAAVDEATDYLIDIDI